MKSNLIFAIILLMAALGVWKYQSMRNQQPVQQNEQPAPVAESGDITVTDEGVSLSEEAKKSIISDVTESGLGDNYVEEETVAASADVEDPKDNVERIFVNGPNTLPMEECLEKFKNSAHEIAMYVGGGHIDTKDYSICHDIADNDMTFCGLGDQRCEPSVKQFRFVYQVMSGGQYSTKDCTDAYSIPAALCKGFAGMLKSGEGEIPAQFKPYLLYLSGRTSSCSSLSRDNKYDCVLMADVVAGIRTGVNRFFLYDALSKQDCSRTDTAIVEKYCSNKIK